MNLIVIANKKYPTDFRKYLMQAAESAGAKAIHIYMWEEVIVTSGGKELLQVSDMTDKVAVFEQVRTMLGEGPILVLTGLGGRYTPYAMTAKRYLPRAQFVYDVYDNFRYGAKGRELLHWIIREFRWRLHTNWSIVLHKGLKWYYPTAYHLNNASHVRPLERSHALDPSKVVYIGSIDSRVDWKWLNEFASHAVSIDIYGQVHMNNQEVKNHLEMLISAHKNVNYVGAYDNNDLFQILQNYSVGIVPYKLHHPMTKYVNPDKIYHYLNSGMEVVLPGFPQALNLAPYLHIMNDCRQWPVVMQSICQLPKAVHWPAAEYTWEQRWKELCAQVLLHGT